jgi:hypothetical protein
MKQKEVLAGSKLDKQEEESERRIPIPTASSSRVAQRRA